MELILFSRQVLSHLLSPGPGTAIPPILLHPAALRPGRGSGSRFREGWLHAHHAQKGHGSFTLSQASRVMGDLTGMSLPPGTKHFPVQRFRSFRSHLSLWVRAMGPWQGETDLLAPGQGMACYAVNPLAFGRNPGIYTTSSWGSLVPVRVFIYPVRIPLPLGVQH